jgi:CBS domain-containing protein
MGLREYIKHETVADMPVRPALTILPQATLSEAVRLMRDNALGCVFVVDDRGRPIGKFTERQMVKLVCACVPMDETVGKHMVEVPEAGCVRLSDTVQKVLENMRQTRLRFICIVDDTGRVTGMTGQKGLMEYLAEHFPRQIKVQMMDSKLHMNAREGA